jgi:hypothetical protein
MRSRGQLEIATLVSSSWMPYAPHGVKGTDDDDDKIKKSSIFIWADIAHQLQGLHIQQGAPKMYPNWHVLGVAVSQPLAFPAVQCTAYKLQRANYVYTECQAVGDTWLWQC